MSILLPVDRSHCVMFSIIFTLEVKQQHEGARRPSCAVPAICEPDGESDVHAQEGVLLRPSATMDCVVKNLPVSGFSQFQMMTNSLLCTILSTLL